MKQPIIINVLRAETYQDCHIPNSINVPLNELEQYAKNNLKKDDYIILQCAHYECQASTNAWKLLDRLGYTNVWTYEGGLVEWKLKNYPLVGNCNAAEKFLKNPPVKPQTTDETIKTISAEELKSVMQKYGML